MLFVLIFFGAKKIPEIARGMGKGIREFKDATKEIKNEINEGSKEESDSKA
ncbi:MAG: twin-arginine translocase TatA/TatE family subunit [Ekhidna sp.]